MRSILPFPSSVSPGSFVFHVFRSLFFFLLIGQDIGNWVGGSRNSMKKKTLVGILSIARRYVVYRKWSMTEELGMDGWIMDGWMNELLDKI